MIKTVHGWSLESRSDRSIPKGQPLTYDFGVIAEKGDTPPRIEFAGAVHRVMARGDRRKEIFLLLLDNVDRPKLLEPAQVQKLPREDWLTGKAEA
jgi:hypothetical protein